MLSTLKTSGSNIQIFDKDYMPPAKASQVAKFSLHASTREKELLDDNEGFFSSLPPLALKELKKTREVNFCSPREKE